LWGDITSLAEPSLGEFAINTASKIGYEVIEMAKRTASF
jgi:hypothetical protein